MARVKRSADEQRRIGVPADQTRIDVLERVIAKLIAFSITAGDMQANDPDKLELSAIKDKLDQLDTDFPDSR